MEPHYEIRLYTTKEGKRPFVDWLESLDAPIRYRIKERLDRLRLGNLSDYKALGDGLYELRFHFGSGYRLYFAFKGRQVVLLLCGGHKALQKKDIKKAKQYWADYLTR